MTTAAAPTGPQRFGPFVLLKALGRGAMGDVHLARAADPRRGLPAPLVLKRLHGELADNPAFVARFRHEAALAVTVDHPQVVKVFDVGAVGGTLYIAMEHVSGWPLSEFLDAVFRSGQYAAIDSVVDLVAGGLEGLVALHAAVDPATGQPLGIVHRDLSARNVMVGVDGRLRLIDLGLGKSNVQEWRTRTGVVMGSPGYMPPEQARGERVDARADVYAMGVALFEFLTLRPYVKRGPVAQMMAATLAPTFVPPSSVRPDVPPELDRVLARALAADREARYPTAAAFLADLRALVPRDPDAARMRQLLAEVYGDELRQRAVELEALLSQPLPGDDDEPEALATEVFATRVGFLEPVAVEPTVAARAPSITRAVPRGPRSGSGLGPALEPTAVSPRAPAEPARRPRSALVGALTVVALAVSVTALGMALRYRAQPEVRVVPPRPAPAVEVAAVPRAAPSAPRAAPSVTPRPSAPRADGVAPVAPTSARPRPARPEPAAPAPATSPPATPPPAVPPRVASAPESPEVALARLQASASRLRDESQGELKGRALDLLAAISLARASEDPEKKAAAVVALEARLKALRP
jgi:hypothetical protein